MNKDLAIGLAVGAVVGLGGFFAYTQFTKEAAPVIQNPNTNTPTTTPNTSTTTPNTPNNPNTPNTPSAQTMQVKIALLNTTGEGSGKQRGCDRVAMVTRTVPLSNTPLAAAIQALFAEPEGTQPDTEYNFIARTKTTLKFDKVTIANGTANIYLTGSLSGLAGVCDDPRAQIQLEETALQFASVQKVQLYLNGNKTNLTPSQQ